METNLVDSSFLFEQLFDYSETSLMWIQSESI
jgi:hypothetical protein